MRTLAVKEPSHTQRRQAEVNRAVVQPSHRSLSSGVLQRKSSCACGGGCPRCQERALLQTKLKISEPGDVYEQEADRIADEVMRMPEPSVQRQVEPEEDEEEEMVQRQAIAQQDTSEVPSIVNEVLNSSGQPLDSETLTFMESRFEQDFSQVRVHTDAKATESAQALNAQAYTVRQNIVFGAEQYAPKTAAGQQLLAHELTHTIQQSQLAPASQPALSIEKLFGRDEEADKSANFAVRGKSAMPLFSHNSALAIATPTVQMQKKRKKRKKKQQKQPQTKPKEPDNSCEVVLLNPVKSLVVKQFGNTNLIWTGQIATSIFGDGIISVRSILSELDEYSLELKEIVRATQVMTVACTSKCNIDKNPFDNDVATIDTFKHLGIEGYVAAQITTTNKSSAKISTKLTASAKLTDLATQSDSKYPAQEVVEWECRPK
jgi:hypothetical protein